MNTINWLEEVVKRKEDLVKDTQAFLQIDSVLDEDTKGESAPFGKGIDQALQFLLTKGTTEGFTVKNVDGYAGHIEFGNGEELVGVLCHIDVVPPGDGWTSPPFSAEIRDGKIFARGALDDKGPTMAAFYALKIIKELDLEVNKRLRIIIGTDEESNWECVEHYFKHEEMPSLGFAPDADFPIIYAEKGILDCKINQEVSSNSGDSRHTLVSLSSGRRLNMVPDLAVAKVVGETASVKEKFEKFLSENNLDGSLEVNETEIDLKLIGVSAHGMEPKNGVNAGTKLIQFLTTLEFDQQGSLFLKVGDTYFADDSRGHSLEISSSDEVSGELTMNVGTISYDRELGGSFGLNIRYPVTLNSDHTVSMITEKIKPYGFKIASLSDSKPHHVEKEHELVKTLQRVYTEQTGEEATLLSIGGGTYARSLEVGVAFGPLFPGRPDIAHQKDEYIEVDDLVRATALYAQAIYELIKK
ncbi:succinyl-diaminopimelate desuccinylase [Bacillus mesophilus]|uniref:dipeptidase PepV n=1 Tax=Bacillus mesophilus TaxID=1808955 RepID=UPI0013D81B58|nr:dipeptidase PepV [Bacillus mesophilus]MBM7660476.1 succinyl-diaminopimelate desuccinylase [Bacillus mesophilus]